jgi:hypothetical protein
MVEQKRKRLEEVIDLNFVESNLMEVIISGASLWGTPSGKKRCVVVFKYSKVCCSHNSLSSSSIFSTVLPFSCPDPMFGAFGLYDEKLGNGSGYIFCSCLNFLISLCFYQIPIFFHLQTNYSISAAQLQFLSWFDYMLAAKHILAFTEVEPT